MPKGVEHVNSGMPCCSNPLVPIPLMPKGVEHIYKDGDANMAAIVPIPLMPKGVVLPVHLTNPDPGRLCHHPASSIGKW